MERLVRHIPFNPDHSEIYEEYQEEVFLHVETLALTFLRRRLLESTPRPRLIVLTGDAGHGKTHMVRHLLGSLGVEEDQLLETLQKHCKGEPLELSTGRIAIHKDLSELDPRGAAALLDRGLNREDCPLVVCVNEGRLRALLSHPILQERSLSRDILRALRTHEVEPQERVLCINLNWQMVSLRDGIMTRLLGSILHGNRWRTCGDCISRHRCPILANRNALDDRRVERIRQLYELAEQLGEVVTIRQVLIHLAFLVTGNLSCELVHEQDEHEDLAPFAFTSNLFGEGAPEDFIVSHGLFASLRRLDPAHNASRAVDEKLMDSDYRQQIIPEQAPDRIQRVGRHEVHLRQELAPAELDLDIKRHLEDEEKILVRVFRALRRHHALASEESELGGFEFREHFQALLDGELRYRERQELMRKVVQGLNRIQSLVTRRRASRLHIVDRVSLRAAARTAVIAESFRLDAITLEPEVIPTTRDGEQASDATPRRLVLGIGGEKLRLDLLSFEFICRCAHGLASREFFGNEVRRITNFLLRVVEHRQSEDTCRAQVFHQGELHGIRVRPEQKFIEPE